jgi:hypothetical protein
MQNDHKTWFESEKNQNKARISQGDIAKNSGVTEDL